MNEGQREAVSQIVAAIIIVAILLMLGVLSSGCVTTPKPPPSCSDFLKEQVAIKKKDGCELYDHVVLQGTQGVTHLAMVWECKKDFQGLLFLNEKDTENVTAATKSLPLAGRCVREDGAAISVVIPKPLPKPAPAPVTL